MDDWALLRWGRGRWIAATAIWRRISPRTHDVVFIAVAVAITAGMTLSDGVQLGIVGRQWSIVLAGSAIVLLWWRRSRPVLLTVVGCLVMALTSVFPLASIGLFSTAIRRRGPALFVLAIVHLGAYNLGAWGADGESWDAVVFFAIFTIALAAGGAYIGARRDLLMSLRDRAERAESERELRAAQARVSERSRIAGEMHDVLAHKVSLIALHAGGLEVNASAPAEQVEHTAALIRSTAHEALQDLRGVLGVLRTAGADGERTALAPQPGYSDVPRLIAASRAAGIRIDSELIVADLPEALGRTAFRVIQESLTNVHKHARGAATSVRVSGSAGSRLIVVVANRRPVSAETLLPGSGSGLDSLRERVDLLDGTFSSGPTDDGGWQLRVDLPWPARVTLAQTGRS
ncbi:sensor histidine kinase [Nakamurella lactea]|uniref:sensor histidine kinase n=1 Tax=Nakamurella lactea TaxID=459515 RepID=UPI00041B45A3|nr:histidine kinase [Nakamurella lactea]